MDIRAFRLIIDVCSEIPYQLKAEIWNSGFGYGWENWGGFGKCDLCYTFAEEMARHYADMLGVDLLETRYVDDASRDWYIDRRYVEFTRKYPYRAKNDSLS